MRVFPLSSFRAVPSLLLGLLATAAARGQAAPGGAPPSVIASVTSVATTLGANGWRYLTCGVHLENRTKKPVALGLDASKSGASDEKGNRYAVLAVRGIGKVAGATADPSFVLAEGKGGDALLEMRWRGERSVEFGVTFDLDLVLREIATLPSGGLRLGPERVVALPGLRDGFAASPAGAPPVSEHTVDAGPFTAKVVRAKAGMTANRRYRTMDLAVRLTNTSDAPLTLGYESGTSSGTDDGGNNWAYGTAGTHDASAVGIGLVTSAAADPQLVLAPGESREVRFTLLHQMARETMGARLAWSVALQAMAVAPSGQVRRLREYSLTFPGLDLGR